MIENPPNSFKEEMTSHLKQNAARLVLVLVIINLFTSVLNALKGTSCFSHVIQFFLIFNIHTPDTHVLHVYIKTTDKFTGFCRGAKINLDGERLNTS